MILSIQFISTDFYPRSPCGERPFRNQETESEFVISIHALLAESDCFFCVKLLLQLIFLSTLSLRRATMDKAREVNPTLFLSTLSLRRATENTVIGFLSYEFLSTLSLRRATVWERGRVLTVRFLSTLSLRRATGKACRYQQGHRISIHALLAESDLIVKVTRLYPPKFLSTLSLRRATAQIC